MNAVVATALLVVLTETGQTRQGLPVYAVHPQTKTIAMQLDRGVTAEMLRVYRLLQVRRQRTKQTVIEPAYLLLSTKQGGFARYGFWLGSEKKDGVAYVDVHRDWKLSGQLGAVDQIFPHELSHAILHQLGVEPPAESRSNQVHAVGVRTDRFTALNEGLAEHFQVMAVDHPSAAPATRALANDREAAMAAAKHLAAYGRELRARFSPASRMRIGFPLWYSGDERVLRYFAVKENRFARITPVPTQLLERDPYAAYLIESVVPAPVGAPFKSVPRLLASEGAVSSLFHTWATNPDLQRRREDAFYEPFGVRAANVTPLQNVYLKLYSTAGKGTPDLPSLIASYERSFPDEAPAVRAVVSRTFGGQPLVSPPELWLASDRLKTGTTLFDQFRGVPRVHTFDLNAASPVDLMSIGGITPEVASAIASAAPFRAIEDVARANGVTPAVLARIRSMAVAMKKLDSADEEQLSLTAIFLPYLWRALAVLLLAAAASAAFYRLVRRDRSIIRAIFAGLGSALVALAASWVIGSPLAAFAAVAVLFGLPAAALTLRRARSFQAAAISIALWIALAAPGVLMTAAI